jgi:enterochelin esterase-like enzyme
MGRIETPGHRTVSRISCRSWYDPGSMSPARARLRPRLRSALIGSLLIVTLLAGARDGRADAPIAGTLASGSFASTAGPLEYDVYLPPGYAASAKRYPVIYYLHGLPSGGAAFHSFGWVVRAVEQAGLPAIVVAPQGATDADQDPEYLDKGPGNEWETALAVQLPRIIDARYRTIADRTGRGLVGVSAGGYGAMLLGLHHLGLFAGIESWSGYFHPTSPDGTKSISSRPWLSAHSFVSSLPRAFAVHPTFLAFYIGSQDQLFRGENVQFARELSRVGVDFFFRMFPAGHTQALWSAQAPGWLTMLAGHLAAPKA